MRGWHWMAEKPASDKDGIICHLLLPAIQEALTREARGNNILPPTVKVDIYTQSCWSSAAGWLTVTFKQPGKQPSVQPSQSRLEILTVVWNEARDSTHGVCLEMPRGIRQAAGKGGTSLFQMECEKELFWMLPSTHTLMHTQGWSSWIRIGATENSISMSAAGSWHLQTLALASHWVKGCMYPSGVFEKQNKT